MTEDSVVCAMASIPNRAKQMLNVAKSISKQCDILCISLNGYDRIPDELRGYDNVIPVLSGNGKHIPDLGCLNKMMWIGDFPGYYATVDDDLNYSQGYISILKESMKRHGNNAICSFHGIIYSVACGEIDFDRPHKSIIYSARNDVDTEVHRIGMGVAMMHPKTIGIRKELFISRIRNFGDDELVSTWCNMNGIRRIVVKHPEKIVTPDTCAFNGLYTNKRSLKFRDEYLKTFRNWKELKWN